MRKLLCIIGVLSVIMTALPILGIGIDPTSTQTRDNIITVGPEGDYQSIREAVENASEGDTIKVSYGTYEETIVVNKTLTITADGEQRPVLKSSKTGLYITADDVMVSGFRFENQPGSSRQINGIASFDNRDLLIKNCEFHCIIGIYLQNVTTTVIKDNKFASNETGVDVFRSTNITISHNDFTGNESITLWSARSIIIQDNICHDVRGIVFNGLSYNNEIRNNEITNSSLGIRLYLGKSNQVRDNTINGGKTGILIEEEEGSEVSGNKISDCSDFGIICTFSSQRIGIISNSISGCSSGIHVGVHPIHLFIQSCMIVSMIGNSVIDCGIGINISALKSVDIINCTIEGNGIGIKARITDVGTISRNIIRSNAGYGLDLGGGDSFPQPPKNFTIFSNSIVRNNGAGNILDPSHVQAFGNATVKNNIQWDKDGSGNFWSDWTIPDNDSDGIVDDPYVIGSIDRDDYPLATPPMSMIWNHPPVFNMPYPSYEIDEDSPGIDIDLSLLVYDSDGDPLNFRVSTGSNLTLTLTDDVLLVDYKEDWFGKDFIDVIASDGIEEATISIWVTVKNVNHPPDISDVEVPSSMKAGEGIELKATADDVDPDDELTYVWSIEGIGEVGRGASVNITLDAGTYNLTLTIIDGSGASVTKDMVLVVEDGSVGPPVESAVPWVMIVVALVIVSCAAISVGYFIIKRRKGPTHTDDRSIIPSEAPGVRSGKLGGGSPLRSHGYGSDPEVGSLYDDLVEGDRIPGTDRTRLKDTLKRELDDGRIDQDDYDEMIGILRMTEE